MSEISDVSKTETKQKQPYLNRNFLNSTPVRISHKCFESADGNNANLSPVIFLHGIICSKEVWDEIPQIIANKTKRKVYSLDARNHGESEYNEHFNVDLNVIDLFSFMDLMNINKAILVGHSMGSITATKAALMKPHRVEMIFSEDIFVKKVPNDLVKSVIDYILVWSDSIQSIPKEVNEKDAVKYAVEILFEKLPKDCTPLSSKESMIKMKYVFKRNQDGGYDTAFNKDVLIRCLQNPEDLMSNPTGTFNGPSYFIYGSESPFNVGSEETNIKEHFPNAELIEFKGLSHNIHAVIPEKFIQNILYRLQQ